MKKNSLGRGLGVLLPEVDEPQLSGENVIVEIPLGDIDPNREQPRKRFEEEPMRQLAASIEQSGVIQPIIVFPKGDRYTIVAGERRWRAARMAGLTTIPAIVRDYDRVKQHEVALIENIQRENLNPIEEAAAIRSLMDECGLTQEAVASRLGRSRPAVANLLRILSLPEDIQKRVREGALSAGHARTLAGVESVADQRALAAQAIQLNWSVRQLEIAAQQDVDHTPKAPKPQHAKPVEFDELEEIMLRAFGVKAAINGNMKKGRIVLNYASQDELEAIYAAVQKIGQ